MQKTSDRFYPAAGGLTTLGDYSNHKIFCDRTRSLWEDNKAGLTLSAHHRDRDSDHDLET
ncbi:hypothetical protein NG791_11385 [Laspinema sp. D1]|uniref:hypothetical protein n=1 Tax=Laspinema palackyanum TaxID=3231601 RepID=UPI00347683AB|nr:hypothetical protein [Laspinema sp. D2b]